MKKRKNDFYILITYVVIFLGSLSSLYFYDDLFLNKEIKKSDEKLIARVMSFQREVKYKHKEQIRWNQIERDKKLYLNDSLYTGERSKVTFLSNNTQITLFSSSLITFRGKSIELGRGNIVADIDKGEVLDLSVNGEKLQVKGGGIQKLLLKVQRMEKLRSMLCLVR